MTCDPAIHQHRSLFILAKFRKLANMTIFKDLCGLPSRTTNTWESQLDRQRCTLQAGVCPSHEKCSSQPARCSRSRFDGTDTTPSAAGDWPVQRRGGNLIRKSCIGRDLCGKGVGPVASRRPLRPVMRDGWEKESGGTITRGRTACRWRV